MTNPNEREALDAAVESIVRSAMAVQVLYNRGQTDLEDGALVTAVERLREDATVIIAAIEEK